MITIGRVLSKEGGAGQSHNFRGLKSVSTTYRSATCSGKTEVSLGLRKDFPDYMPSCFHLYLGWWSVGGLLKNLVHCD